MLTHAYRLTFRYASRHVQMKTHSMSCHHMLVSVYAT